MGCMSINTKVYVLQMNNVCASIDGGKLQCYDQSKPSRSDAPSFDDVMYRYDRYFLLMLMVRHTGLNFRLYIAI